MSATLAIRHNVSDYAAWRKVYDELKPLRPGADAPRSGSCGCQRTATTCSSRTSSPTAEQGGQTSRMTRRSGAGMQSAGVEGAPRIEIFTDV